MDNQTLHQLKMLSAGPTGALLARRVTRDLAGIERRLDRDSLARLECEAARILRRQLATDEVACGTGEGQGDLADTLLEIVLRFARDDGTRH